MAVENGYGTELDMVVDEETPENNVESNETKSAEKEKNLEESGKTEDTVKEENVNTNLQATTSDNVDDEPTTVFMEVEEVVENDPLADDDHSEDRIITASCGKNGISEEKDSKNNDKANGDINDDAPPPEPVVTEYVKEYSGRFSGRKASTSSNAVDPSTVKIKEEPNEIVVIDSEEEKDEKPKVKVVAVKNVQSVKQNAKPASRSYNSNSRNSGSDFQIVSVDDDSPMNKNDPMNVFLCSTEEREFRKDYFKDPSSNVLKQRLHCTICDIHIGACPQNSKNMVCHRFLKVLVCRKCANFYGQGDFPQDDGSDEFCRWCGEGGEVFLCNSCSNVFCQACILRNFGMTEVKRVDRLENWDCYVCDTRPLWTLRAIAFALFTYVRRIKVVAYRNGMYQTINSASAKVSKSDLMALETDLSTCCPKEVKAAAAAASAPPPRETEKQPLLKPKENKIVNQLSAVRTPMNKASPALNKPAEVSPQFVSNNVYGQHQQPSAAPKSAKRSKQPAKQQMAPAASWQQPQPQLVTEYFPGPGKRVPNQGAYTISQPSVIYPPQSSTLRTALVGQPTSYLQPQPLVANSFGGQNHVMMFSPTSTVPGGNDGKSEQAVLHWFNGILISLMDTMKNIDNRLVFIRNSMTNLISQNEISFLVNQLHNLLKVSCSKMQEVDCDLLKNYKKFIDKSEISVNDFDDIVREFPEFFKPTENNTEPPDSNDTDPDPPDPDEINPMALVEVIEDGDQSSVSLSQSSCDFSKQTPNSDENKSSAQSASNSTQSSSAKSIPTVHPCSVIIKKEITGDDLPNETSDKNNKNGASKRKSEDNHDKNKSKVQVVEKIHIKKEVEEDSLSELEKSCGIKKCTVSLTSVSCGSSSEKS